MAFGEKLLNMFGRRTAGTSFVQAAASEQRHDGQHLCTRAQLKNREEIGKVVTQNIASD